MKICRLANEDSCPNGRICCHTCKEYRSCYYACERKVETCNAVVEDTEEKTTDALVK